LKFLGRARRFLQELASEPEGKVQYFNVTCGSGHRVRGERTEGYQALRCPACGDGVFVLPRSPLPEPAAPARSTASRGARRGRGPINDGPVELTDPGRAALDAGGDEPNATDAEIIWDDEPADTTRQGDRGHVRKQPGNAGAEAGEESEDFWEDDLNRAATAPAGEVAPARRKLREPAQTAGAHARATKQTQPAPGSTRPGKPRRSPAVPTIEIPPTRKKPALLTLVLILVPVMVATAVAWRIRQNIRKEYPLIAERGRTEGIPALEAGDFDKAFQLLSAAKTAVDGLGGEVDGAEKIRTAAKEAEIFVNLCPRSLEEMLDEAGRAGSDTWPSKFNNLYKGRTILIDSVITEVPGSGSSSGYVVEYVIVPPGGTNNFADVRDAPPDRWGLIDFEGFKLFELSPPRKGDHVTFGARLASFNIDTTGTVTVWRIGLEADSGIFIVHTKALEAVGFPGAAKAELPPETQP
jgi:DNA-directed RNA polymerase subunit RPC12/RpoP